MSLSARDEGLQVLGKDGNTACECQKELRIICTASPRVTLSLPCGLGQVIGLEKVRG